MMKPENPLGENCLNPGCDMKARCRGLCDACYRAGQQAIRKYKITWEKLVKKGKCLEPQRKPSHRLAWMIDWMKPRGRKPKLRKVK